MNKKTSLVAGALVAAVAVGSFSVAEAATTKSAKMVNSVAAAKPTIGGANAMGANPLKAILDGLVTKGTITQAQEDAIVAAFTAAQPLTGNHGPRMGGMGAEDPAQQAAEQATVLSVLGIDATALQAAKASGKSLATLAGAKTQALINALVALENKEIDAAVTAGKLTAAQATTQKANTVAHVTAHVNATPGQPGVGGMGMGHRGGHGRGPAPVTPPTNG
jgi:polyhydroxyalkanoate synthesis regulator phasin